MTPPAAPTAARLRHLVLEAIDSVASPAVRDRVLARACRTAALDAMPASSAELVVFLYGFVLDELAGAVGEEAANTVLAEIEQILDRPRQRRPPAQPRKTPASRAPASSAPASSAPGLEYSPPMEGAGAPPEPMPRGPRHSGVHPVVPTALLATVDRGARDAVFGVAERLGWRLLIVADGFNALALCSRHRPAIVLCDLVLPAIDGPSLAQLITLARGERTPRIVLLAADRRFPRVSPYIHTVLFKPLDERALADELLDARPIPPPPAVVSTDAAMLLGAGHDLR